MKKPNKPDCTEPRDCVSVACLGPATTLLRRMLKHHHVAERVTILKL